MAAYFHANNGLVTATHMGRLQRVFDVLSGLFNRVGLWTNSRKMVNMACNPCLTLGKMSSAAYNQRRKGMGPIFWERNWRRVACPEFGVEVAVGSLLNHHQSQHGIGRGDWRGTPPPPPPGEAQTYRVSFTKRLWRLR